MRAGTGARSGSRRTAPSSGRHARTLLGLLLIGCLLPACAVSSRTPVASGPPLELERFFSGRTTAVGTVSNRSGKVTRRFRAVADGVWSEQEQALTVRETWYWDDGEVEPRLWRWEKKSEQQWQGFEEDLTAPARGQALGSTVRWTYSMGVDTDAYGRVTIRADDVMHQVDADNIINLVDLSYWGFHVGQVVLHIQRGGRAIEPWPASPSE
jgi:hypothetical protein